VASVVDPLPYQHSEVVVGFVAPVGTDLQSIVNRLQKKIRRFDYKINHLRISGFLQFVEPRSFGVRLKDTPEFARISTRMDAGNALRDATGKNDILAIHAIHEIQRSRPLGRKSEREPYTNTIHVLNSLKHPDEVRTLRRVYGPGFFLIGVYSCEADRERHLNRDLGIPLSQTRELIARDSDEEQAFGQHTADTFQLADVFIRAGDEGEDQLSRFVDLLFSNPFITPTFDENAMFLAYAASFRSADLSRQVGAVVVSKEREVIATGANDVPKFGGGQYWYGENDQRDWRRGYDSNKKQIREILQDTLNRLGLAGRSGFDLDKVERKLRGGRLYDLTEFGRAVHAEMAALLACARRAVSPLHGTLYVTTFPCHNCAKHVIAAGIRRVVYVEPYAKSRAIELHDDAITLDESAIDDGPNGKVKFLPFIGVAARRYVDLFSMKLSSGSPAVRQLNGIAVDWMASDPGPRLGMVAASYIEREKIFATELGRVASKTKRRRRGPKKNQRSS
jgi:deoxycytidylate deaminase